MLYRPATDGFYRRSCIVIVRLVRLQEGFQVDFGGENDVFMIWRGGWRLKKMKGGWIESPTQAQDLL